MSDRAARVRLDVRWDPGTLEVARMVATERGLKVGVVMRMAVEIGLSTLANGEGGTRAWVARTGEGVRISGRPSGEVVTVPVAGGSSSRELAGADDPRPSAPALPAVRLEAVVARLLAAHGGQVAAGSGAAIDALRAGSGRAPAPADLARARRKVLGGDVRVLGGVCRNPVQLVDPVDVSIG